MSRKRVVDEDVRFNIIINGNQGQKELYNLEKRQRELTASNKSLNAEKAKLVSQGKKNSAQYRNLSAEIKRNNVELTQNRSRMDVLQKQFGVTSLTMAQLNQRASQLRLQLRHMIPGTAQHKKLSAELRVINTRLTELRVNSAAAQSSVHRLADTFTRFAVLGGTIIATITGLVLSIQRLIDFNGELSDAQADVMKTTNLTKEEVDQLTRSFGLLKTRTARMELLKLAEEAGRLGITGVKNLEDFVAVANKIKVALGDVLNDEQIKEVGKMTNIFQVGKETNREYAESFESLGSAINAVSMEGANQADFLVDFLKRTAGVASSANISATAIIGMAAAFDEAGASRETSATAINKTLISMGQNTEKFAQIAGMSVKDFSKLLNEDANEAMFAFLEGLARGNPSLEELSQRLSGVEVGGARGVASILALTRNLDTMRKRQEQATKAMIENTSVADEYNIKNENLAATIAKVRRQMMGWFTNEKIVNGMTSFMHWFAKFIGAADDADGSVTRFRNNLVAFLKVLMVVLIAVISYNAAIKLSAILTTSAWKATKLYELAMRVSALTTRLYTASKYLLVAAYSALTGNIGRARAALVMFNRTLLISPLGAFVAILSAAAAAYYLFSKNVSNTARAQKDLLEINRQVAQNIAKERFEVERLVKLAQDEAQSKENRLKAIKKLNDISPEYLGNLNMENINTIETTKSVYNYIKALEKKALAQAIETKQQEAFNKLISDQMDAQESYNKKLADIPRRLADRRQGQQSVVAGGGPEATYDAAADRANLEKQYEQQLTTAKDAAQKAYDEYITELNKVVEGAPTLTDLILGDDDDDSPKPTPPGATADTSKADELKKQQAELLKMIREGEDRRLALIQDSFKREMLINDTNHLRKVQDLEAKANEIVESYDKAIAAGNTEAASALLDQYHAVYDRIEVEEVHHQRRRNEIIQFGINEQLRVLEEDFKRETTLRETLHQEELLALGNNEKAKKKLQDDYNREKLENEKKHLTELTQLAQSIMDSGEFEGFSLDLLSEDEKNAIIKRLEELGLSISQINVLLAAMQNGGQEGGLMGLGDGNKTDILGFTLEDWEMFFENIDTVEGKMQALTAGITAMQNAWGMYHQYVNASENKSFRKFEKSQQDQVRALEHRHSRGYISQRQYEKAIEELEKEHDKRKAELEYKQAKRKWQADLLNAIVGTAQATINGFNTQPFFPLGIAMGALAGVLGTLQIATIRKNKPVKGFESGFYNKSTIPIQREQDGKMFNATFGGQSRSGVVDKPTVYLAGEGGKNFPEMIIDGRTLKQFDPGLKESLYRELSRVRGFENGYYGGASQPQPSGESQAVIQQNTAAMMHMISLLEKLDRDGVTALLDKDMRNIYKLRKEFKRLEDFENKSKVNT